MKHSWNVARKQCINLTNPTRSESTKIKKLNGTWKKKKNKRRGIEINKNENFFSTRKSPLATSQGSRAIKRATTKHQSLFEEKERKTKEKEEEGE